MNGKAMHVYICYIWYSELWTFHIDILLCHVTGGMLFSWGSSVKMGGSFLPLNGSLKKLTSGVKANVNITIVSSHSQLDRI